MEIFSYDEALSASTSYFNGDDLAAKVFIDKYALRDSESQLVEKTPDMMHKRLSAEFARIEKGKFKNPLSEEEIFSLLDRFKYVCPQGSPMFGIGNNHQIISLSNCYVVESPQDSIGGIMRTDQQLAQISKRRGGVGSDMDNLRPAGCSTKNSSRSSTGVPAFSERYSNTIREIGQSGRRGALMLTISIHHPDCVRVDESQWDSPTPVLLKGDSSKGERDIETDSRFYDEKNPDFCSMKLNRSKVTGANVSIKLTDEFLQAVKNGEKYEQRFPVNYKELGVKPLVSKMVDARKAWKKIIHCAWQAAEPGLLFWDLITNYNAIDCYAKYGFKTVSTNPCSELPLCILDSCRLLIQNLYSYVKNPFQKDAEFDFDLFKQHAKTSQRLMDDLIDLEIEKIDAIIAKIKADPEEEIIKREELTLWMNIRQKCTDGRRTGLGITAEGDMLAALGIAYGSKQSIKMIEAVHKAQKLAAFASSMEMAKELGAFPVWSHELEKDSAFLLQIKKEDEELWNNLKKYGRRNIGILTIAPAGSVSILTQTSSGIEPLFNIAPYTRRKKINHNDDNTRIDFVDANGDKWQEFEVLHPKLKVWMDATGETDWKKSPWYGCCAKDIDWKQRVEVQAAAQRHIDHAISSTINLPTDVTEEKVAEIYQTAWESGCKGMTVYREGCRSGVLINKKAEESIEKTHAPKRPKEIRGEIFPLRSKQQDLYVAVGFMGNDLYEVFSGLNSKHQIEHCKGKIVKNARGKYVFYGDEGFEFHLNNGNSDENADVLCRVISASLRHGCDLSFLVHQLEKSEGDLTSFSKVICRVLKKFIKDSTRVIGEECAECKGALTRENGCKSCKNCGWSACN